MTGVDATEGHREPLGVGTRRQLQPHLTDKPKLHKDIEALIAQFEAAGWRIVYRKN